MRENRQTVIQNGPNAPIVNEEITNLNFLLNANSYQKGGWVLHMLRTELGAEMFRKCVKTYLERHALSCVVTEDFRSIIEELTGRSYDRFAF